MIFFVSACVTAMYLLLSPNPFFFHPALLSPIQDTGHEKAIKFKQVYTGCTKCINFYTLAVVQLTKANMF